MNQTQFGAFWSQLKAPLKAKWEKITDGDLLEIGGDLATFTAVLAKRYGTTQNGEVNTWANRRYSHWSGSVAPIKLHFSGLIAVPMILETILLLAILL